MTATVLGMMLANVDGITFMTSKYFSLVLPLLSAALFSIILTHEYGRRARRYNEMIPFLDYMDKRLVAVKTPGGLVRIASEVEEVLLREVVEWNYFTRFTGKLH